jgi:DNA-binding HxlR family transcriptional regulator
MMREEIKILHAEVRPTVMYMVENVVGCKWSLTVIDLVRCGVNRPGEMEHAVPGLSAKVLNERLRKLVRFGIMEKRSYPEIPPRVEYSLTDFGIRFAKILDAIHALELPGQEIQTITKPKHKPVSA